MRYTDISREFRKQVEILHKVSKKATLDSLRAVEVRNGNLVVTGDLDHWIITPVDLEEDWYNLNGLIPLSEWDTMKLKLKSLEIPVNLAKAETEGVSLSIQELNKLIPLINPKVNYISLRGVYLSSDYLGVCDGHLSVMNQEFRFNGKPGVLDLYTLELLRGLKGELMVSRQGVWFILKHGLTWILSRVASDNFPKIEHFTCPDRLAIELNLEDLKKVEHFSTLKFSEGAIVAFNLDTDPAIKVNLGGCHPQIDVTVDLSKLCKLVKYFDYQVTLEASVFTPMLEMVSKSGTRAVLAGLR